MNWDSTLSRAVSSIEALRVWSDGIGSTNCEDCAVEFQLHVTRIVDVNQPRNVEGYLADLTGQYSTNRPEFERSTCSASSFQMMLVLQLTIRV